MMLHGWVNELKFIAIKLRTLGEKIICTTSLVMFIALISSFTYEKTSLTIFLHVILYLNVMKMFCFLKQIVTSSVQQILYHNAEWRLS